MTDRVEELKAAALADGHLFFAVSAVTGAGLKTLMMVCGEQVSQLRRELASVEEPRALDAVWERKRRCARSASTWFRKSPVPIVWWANRWSAWWCRPTGKTKRRHLPAASLYSHGRR